jgi:hypothetical protein
MPVSPRALAFAVLAILGGVACNDALTGPATVDLTGRWITGFTVSETGFTCEFHDIVFVFDSLSPNPALMFGGTGTCVGLGRNDSLFVSSSSLDSLVMGGGKLRFVAFNGSWHFTGRIVSADSLSGTLTEDGMYVGIGTFHLVGPWGAKRQPPPPP